MTVRLVLLRIAIALLIVVGAPVTFIVLLLMASTVLPPGGQVSVPVGLAVGLCFPAGFVGALGLLTDRPWGWPVAATTVVVGIVGVVLTVLRTGDHPAILSVVLVFWTITFAFLLAGAPERRRTS